MSLLSLLGFLFHGAGGRSGAPADHKTPHDRRGGETVDEATGIGQVDGQILDNTSINPEIQDREHGFPVKDPQNPEKG